MKGFECLPWVLSFFWELAWEAMSLKFHLPVSSIFAYFFLIFLLPFVSTEVVTVHSERKTKLWDSPLLLFPALNGKQRKSNHSQLRSLSVWLLQLKYARMSTLQSTNTPFQWPRITTNNCVMLHFPSNIQCCEPLRLSVSVLPLPRLCLFPSPLPMLSRKWSQSK